MSATQAGSVNLEKWLPLLPFGIVSILAPSMAAQIQKQQMEAVRARYEKEFQAELERFRSRTLLVQESESEAIRGDFRSVLGDLGVAFRSVKATLPAP